MFCCGKLCALVLWLCDFIFYLFIADDDTKIQRRHIKLGNNELKRQLATNDRSAAGTEATELFRAEFHPNMAINTENGVGKTHWSGDWFDGWLCARKRRCRFDFCQCEMTRGKIVLDGKSKENLEKICGIQFFFLVFLSFWTVCAYPKLKQQQKIRFRERLALFEQKNWLRFWAINWFGFWGKSGTDFWKISHRLWENQPQTLRKSATDFGEIRHRFCGNPSPTLRKTVADFEEISHRLWGNPSPFLRKSVPEFGEIRHRLWGNPSPILWKSLTDCEENCHRLWGNPSPIVRKSVTDFEEICPWVWGNPSPILGKSVTDFGEIRHRFWGNPSPILGKSVTVFGKLHFWKNRLRVCEKQAPSVGKNRLCVWEKLREKPARFGGRLARFLDWLGTKLKPHCFER